MSLLFFLGVSLTGSSDVKPGELVVQEAAVYRAEGRRLQEMGRPKEALAVYQKAVAVDPKYADAYNDMGVMFETLGQNSRAEEAYKSALRLEPDLTAAHSNLALLYERMGKVKEATEHWAARARIGFPGDLWAMKAREKLVQYNVPVPESPAELEEKKAAQVRLAYQAGLNQMEVKGWDLAAQEFGKVLALDPTNTRAAERLQSVRAKQKEAAQKEAPRFARDIPGLAASQLKNLKEEQMARRKAREIEAAVPKALGKTQKEDSKEAALRKAVESAASKREAKPPIPVEKPAPVVKPTAASDAQALAESLAKEKSKTRRVSVQEIYQRGVTAMRQRSFSEAVVRFEQVLSLDPNHSDAKLALKRAQAALSKAAPTEP